MRFISFAWTMPAVQARRKFVTRRTWKDSHARRFKTGEIVDAFDRLPYVGGKSFAQIRLTCEPYKEPLARMDDSEYDAEGFGYMQAHPELLPERWQGVDLREWFEEWRRSKATVWVVRFDYVD